METHGLRQAKPLASTNFQAARTLLAVGKSLSFRKIHRLRAASGKKPPAFKEIRWLPKKEAQTVSLRKGFCRFLRLFFFFFSGVSAWVSGMVSFRCFEGKGGVLNRFLRGIL